MSKNEVIFKVKLMCSWMMTKDICNFWQKKFKLDEIPIELIDKDDADYFVIVNKPLSSNEYYIPKKTIVLRMEPDSDISLNWNNWYNSKSDFMNFCDYGSKKQSSYHNNVEWHISKTTTELIISKSDNKLLDNFKIKKEEKLSNKVSTVVSNMYYLEGHRKRVDFVKYINDNTKDLIDIFGKNNLKNNKGSLPDNCKDDGLFPYKYTIAVENCDKYNYFTEKITDAILSECLCFYWGCSNISDYIDGRAFIRLDLNNFEKSLEIIKLCISNDEWKKRIDIIRKEKQKLIKEYSFFPRIYSLICWDYYLDKKIIVNNKEKNKLNLANFEEYDNSNYKNFDLHISLWRSYFKKREKDLLIIDNDTTLQNNFVDYFSKIYKNNKDKDYDFMFFCFGENSLEYIPYEKFYDLPPLIYIINKKIDKNKLLKIEKFIDIFSFNLKCLFF